LPRYFADIAGALFQGDRITGLLDGKAVLTATDGLYDHERPGWR